MSVERDVDPYWHDDRALGEVAIGHHPRLVRLRSHVEDERFRGRGSETLFTLREREGLRSYVQSRFYIHAPEGSRREWPVAESQAWYYPADRTAVLWELIPHPQYRQPDPREDLLLRSLWVRYEHFLAERFPDLNQFLTTWEDTWGREVWEGFLTGVGYHKSGLAVFAKPRHP